MFERCPKCQHAPLPADQALPAACPACGIILAKVGQPAHRLPAIVIEDAADGEQRSRLWALLVHVPPRVDSLRFGLRVVLWAVFAAWGLVLAAQDVRSGEIGESFLHRPLLVFHEAGHVVFIAFGPFMAVLGGTLGQLIMPAMMALALLWKSRDPFGAALGLWFLGVSLLDIAPYMYDALQPQLMLLSGRTGEAGGHDWIFLFASLGWLPQAQSIGLATHKLGVGVILVALAWAAWLLKLQWACIDGDVLRET